MKQFLKKFSVYILTVIFSVMTVFGVVLSFHMYDDGVKSHCLLMTDLADYCPMTPLSHIEAWKQVMTALLPWLSLALFSSLVFVFLKTFVASGREQNFKFWLQWRWRSFINRLVLYYNYLRRLLARGILEPTAA